MFDMDQDYFDSRDILDRIKELIQLEEYANDPEASDEEKESFGREEDDELTTLRLFVDAVNNSEFDDGMTFISESYFTEYVKDMVSDFGYISSEVPDWIVINWEETADNLKVDYTEYNLDGYTYYARG